MKPRNKTAGRSKGLVIAGGRHRRFSPVSAAVNKHLLPVYDKPAIYYGLSVLLGMGITEIAVVTDPGSMPALRAVLGHGERFGVRIEYVAQDRPAGIAHAVASAAGFIGGSNCVVVLGDNILLGEDIAPYLDAAMVQEGATIFTKRVSDPSVFGCVECDDRGRPVGIVEKPVKPRSGRAVIGLYVYDTRAVWWAREVRPSERGEMEISGINNRYLAEKALTVVPLPDDALWGDAGTPEGLHAAAIAIRERQFAAGGLLGAPELAAFNAGLISWKSLRRAARTHAPSSYGAALGRAADSALEIMNYGNS